MVSEGLGFLVVLPVLEDVAQGTDVDRRETRFLINIEVNIFCINLKTHIEQSSVTEGCTVFGNPLFMRQCIFWVEPKVEVS